MRGERDAEEQIAAGPTFLLLGFAVDEEEALGSCEANSHVLAPVIRSLFSAWQLAFASDPTPFAEGRHISPASALVAR